ncbi:MAG: CHRD domain-containing protein [Geminicoccaceae bacterium]
MSTVFRVILEGSQEVPANDSTASGEGTVVFDSEAIAASYSFDVEGIDFGPITSGETPTDPDDLTNTHFHNQVLGMAGAVVFGQITPAHDSDDVAFVQNADGSWSESGRWETTDPAPITNLAAVGGDTFANILDSAAVGSDVPLYFNVHTKAFPGGEIRGQLVAVADDIDNVVTGTTGADVLVGTNGNDAILGLAGDDTLGGGNGDDVLDGGGGDDALAGGNGDDQLYGSVGMDSLVGGNGDDLLDGGSGDDALAGGNGDDTLKGGAGDDVLAGGNGEDVLDGGAGDDVLVGGNGRDTVTGGAGDDVLTGGNGPDRFVLNADFGDDVITDWRGNDHIQFGDALFADAEAVLMASAQVGEDTVITAGSNSVTLVGVLLSGLQEDDFSVA